MLHVLELTVPQPYGQPKMHYPCLFRHLARCTPPTTLPLYVSFPLFAAPAACCMCSVCHTRRMGNVFRIVFLVCGRLDSHRPHIVSHCFVFAFELIARCYGCSFTCCPLNLAQLRIENTKLINMLECGVSEKKERKDIFKPLGYILFIFFALTSIIPV